tara:strand:- start:8204 stop:8788 length:585 start_codon:yes stop_codon:yes gene_type:complete
MRIESNEDKILRQEKGINLVSNTNRPIPGQSLTNSPDQPYNWEKPTEFTTVNDCLMYIFDNLLEEDIFENLTSSLDNEVPILDIASAILYTGFLEGKWNPDLMLLLLEPLTYMIMAMGEMYGLKSDEMVITAEDNPSVDDPEVQVKTFKKAMEKAKLSTMEKDAKKENLIPEEIKERLEKIKPSSSLLARPEGE